MARLRRTSIWLCAVSLIAAALPLSWALADEFEADSRVSIEAGGGGNFTGEVSSSHGRCLGDRDVTLFKVRRNKSPRAAGSDTTSGNGTYHINKDDPHGRYFVKVARKLNTSYEHRHDCKGARSSTIFVE